ncbi:MAG: hypothetical protein M1830_001420 [Pleopsidium flavum]|nr:MAG: hypothetical protein M1830_001420 [Pleopsidium flavum]
MKTFTTRIWASLSVLLALIHLTSCTFPTAPSLQDVTCYGTLPPDPITEFPLDVFMAGVDTTRYTDLHALCMERLRPYCACERNDEDGQWDLACRGWETVLAFRQTIYCDLLCYCPNRRSPSPEAEKKLDDWKIAAVHQVDKQLKAEQRHGVA